MDWNNYDAALFDLDGVITPTADVHMRAWDRMFNDFLSSEGIEDRYTERDYFTFVDGKPRSDGVRSFLQSQGISLPEGDPSDGPGERTVSGLGNRKNADFERILTQEGVQPYPGSAVLIEALSSRGIKLAVVSSSRNAPAVLEAAGVKKYFGVIVDGRVAAEEGLPGKPAPDTFIAAANRLAASPARSVVFEDAISGVQAGRAGGFALVVGVDRGAGEAELTRAGADRVVRDLQELV